MLFIDAFVKHKGLHSLEVVFSKPDDSHSIWYNRNIKITIFLIRVMYLWMIQACTNKSKLNAKQHWLILNKHYAICRRLTMMMYLVHTLIFIDSVISNFLLVFAIHTVMKWLFVSFCDSVFVCRFRLHFGGGMEM